MGMFSWFTQDTDERIINGKPMRVVMSDDKGNKYVEYCYEGYGVFGGKDYYELLAEMNGYEIADTEDHRLTIQGPEGSSARVYDSYEAAQDGLRMKGIELAFEGNRHGMNPNVLHPSLTKSGAYFNGEPPAVDPDQGFSDEELWGDYYDF